MRDLREYIVEKLNESNVDPNSQVIESEKSVKDEKTFRDYAENKFKEVFGDELDKDKMKKVIDGILDKYKDEAEKGDWGTLVGALNKSF
jgi:hypothetical protein